MYNFQNKIILLITSLFLTSCSGIFFPEFIVRDKSFNDTEIKIDFSNEINFEKTKTAFLCLEDEIQISGTFSNNGKSISFYPNNGIKKNHNYQVIISQTAESKTGISLENKFTWNFSTKESELPLSILAISQIPNGLSIDLSSPVDKDIFAKSVSISPSIDSIINWNENNTNAKIVFLEEAKLNTRYFLTISNSLYDIYNNNLEKDFHYNFIFEHEYNCDFDFICNYDETSFILTTDECNNSLPTNSQFYFTFNDNINIESFTSSLSILPPIKFQLSQDSFNQKKINLSFSSKPEFNSTYKISIDGEIFPKNKISKNYTLTFDNQIKKAPNFISGFLKYDSKEINFSKDKNINSVLFPVNIFPTVETLPSPDIEFYLIFDVTENSEILYSAAIENIDISSTNGCANISPFNLELFSPKDFDSDEYISNIIKNNFSDLENFSIIKISCHYQNRDNSGLLKLNINKELTDSNLTSLESDLIFIFNKQ